MARYDPTQFERQRQQRRPASGQNKPDCCPDCGAKHLVITNGGWECWECDAFIPRQRRSAITGRMAAVLTPAMEIALRLWIDRVGVTANYHFSHDVFSEHNNQATAWRKSCGRLAAAGYLEADEAFVAAHWPSIVPPYRVTDKALAVLEMTRAQVQPIYATVDDGCPF